MLAARQAAWARVQPGMRARRGRAGARAAWWCWGPHRGAHAPPAVLQQLVVLLADGELAAGHAGANGRVAVVAGPHGLLPCHAASPLPPPAPAPLQHSHLGRLVRCAHALQILAGPAGHARKHALQPAHAGSAGGSAGSSGSGRGASPSGTGGIRSAEQWGLSGGCARPHATGWPHQAFTPHHHTTPAHRTAQQAGARTPPAPACPCKRAPPACARPCIQPAGWLLHRLGSCAWLAPPSCAPAHAPHAPRAGACTRTCTTPSLAPPPPGC